MCGRDVWPPQLRENTYEPCGKVEIIIISIKRGGAYDPCTSTYSLLAYRPHALYMVTSTQKAMEG